MKARGSAAVHVGARRPSCSDTEAQEMPQDFRKIAAHPAQRGEPSQRNSRCFPDFGMRRGVSGCLALSALMREGWKPSRSSCQV